MTSAAASKSLIATATPGALSKAQKAAIVLANLSSVTARTIVDEISDAHLKAVAHALSELKAIPTPLLQVIAKEFISEVEKTASDLTGGIEEARRILTSVTEEERANRILAELSSGDEGSVWGRLEAADEELVVEYIVKQRAAVAAIILSQLSFEKTASILSATPTEAAESILIEISRRPSTASDVIDAIASAVEGEFLKPLSAKPSASGASETLGEIINFLPSAKREDFLVHLDKTDPVVAAAVRSSVVTFEDLHKRLPEAGAAAVLRKLDKSLLLEALKFGQSNATDTVAFILANISKRMAEQYLEEIAEMPDMTEAAGEAAQRKVVKVVKELAKSGEFSLKPATEE